MLLVDGADPTPKLSQASTGEALQCQTHQTIDAQRSGAACAFNRRNKVVLPAPLGPITATRSPACNVQGDIINRHRAVSEHLADMFQPVHASHHLLD